MNLRSTLSRLRRSLTRDDQRSADEIRRLETELADLRAHQAHLEAAHHQAVHQLETARQTRSRFEEQLEVVGEHVRPRERWAPFLTCFAPGSFTSPIPDMAEIDADAERLFGPAPRSLPAIALDEDLVVGWYADVAAALGGEWPFPTEPDPDFRYHAPNLSFETGDAMVLSGALRHHRPQRYLEVGSGFSSAMVLDTRERWLDGRLHCDFIDPYTDNLRRRLRVGDHDDVAIHDRRLQDVPTELFGELERGDILFMDNSHVAKIGSDVVDAFGRVIPAVAPGVIVHVHDIFWPFDYPEAWVREGRAWNEAYVARAFLAFNESFEILGMNSWLAQFHADVVDRSFRTLSAQVPGGFGASLWLRRR